MNAHIILLGIPGFFLAGALLSFLPSGRSFASVVSIIVALGAFVAAGSSGIHVIAGGSITVLENWIGVDGFGALLLVLVSFVGLLAALFSAGYMQERAAERDDRSLRFYHVNFNLFLFSIVTIPLMREVALTWIAVELTTLLSVMLVAFDNTSEALEAAWKYVILTMVGAAIALLGVIVLYRALAQVSGAPFTWRSLETAAPRLSPTLVGASFVLILLGFGVKVGLAPLHTWLPDAHSQAPSPVCAILSGVETSTILFVVLRLFPVVGAQPTLHVRGWAVVFGLISVGSAAFLLIQVKDLKRMFAFSTVEHMGIILTAAGFATASSGFTVPYQLLTHALAKPLCFFAAGAAVVVMGTRELSSLRGLLRRSPIAGAALLIGALAVTGAPPFALFLSELSIIRAGITSRYFVGVGFLAFFVIVAFAAVLYHVNRVVFGPAPPAASGKGDSRESVRLPVVSRFALVLALIPVIVLGVWIPQPVHALLAAAGSSFGGIVP